MTKYTSATDAMSHADITCLSHTHTHISQYHPGKWCFFGGAVFNVHDLKEEAD